MNAEPSIPDELWQQILPAAQAAIRDLIQRYERRLTDLEYQAPGDIHEESQESVR